MNITDHGITCHCRKCTDYWDQDHSTMTHIPSPYGAFPMPDNTLGEIGHNGIGLPTQDRHPATPQPPSDLFHELACIFQRSLNTGEDMTTRPHKITLHMSGVDLIRLIQLAMYQTGERK